MGSKIRELGGIRTPKIYSSAPPRGASERPRTTPTQRSAKGLEIGVYCNGGFAIIIYTVLLTEVGFTNRHLLL